MIEERMKSESRLMIERRGLGAAPLGWKHITNYSVIKESKVYFLYEGGNGDKAKPTHPFNHTKKLKLLFLITEWKRKQSNALVWFLWSGVIKNIL